ncbi:MAG TPA: hypothetical protein VIC82_11460 [Candidatus Nanopelagicales bacterium]
MPLQPEVDDRNPRTPRRGRGEVGAVLVSSVVKFVLVISILVVLVHDGFSLATIQVSLTDDAQQSAQSAHDVLQSGGTAAKAYAAAAAYAKGQGDTMVKSGFAIAKDGSVTVELERTAPTLVAGRISALDKYVTPHISATANDSKY